jgi:4-hydroxy-2-oxovalerate aldolase
MLIPTKKPQILECTLRDGSYAINFQFTASDTALICSALEAAGFDLIEVGHGVGLHAAQAGHGVAAETDEAYLRAAADTLKKARFGMFCIPGIARLEDVDMAAQYKMGFIRIGTNVTEVKASKEYIERAKKHGMLVSANFMKSYAMEPQQFAQQVKLSQQYGSDLVYIVDSAGGMLASDLERYFNAVKGVTDIPLGFHGHNNMGLAVAHTLRAVELGATMIDCTLQGLGRSSGNAPTEIIVSLLKRQGIELGIDLLTVMDVGEKYIKPLIKSNGLSSLDLVAGYAQFHSSYMGLVREYSSKFRIDPRKLIIALCEIDRVNAPRELLEKLAQKIATQKDEVATARYQWDKYIGNEQKDDSSK